MPKATGKKATAKPGDKRLGNDFWTARYNHGRKPKTATPEALWKACVEYFEWVQAIPMVDYKPMIEQQTAIDHPTMRPRAPTQEGLQVFLGISKTTWANWKERKGFLPIQERVEEVMFDWKLAGASAGIFNASIIARNLSLRENTDITSGGEKLEGLRVEHV